MELSSFSENIVTESFERNGETVELQINIDAIVPDYYEQLDERLKPVTKRLQAVQVKFDRMQAELKRLEEEEKEAKEENKDGKKKRKVAPKPMPSVLLLEKEIAEIRREAFAERLTCPVLLPDGTYTALLKGWSIVENGMAILPTKENLMRLPPKAVEELYDRSIAQATTVKKRGGGEIEATSESTPSGSRAPLALAPTG